jgi:hypothetical protein
MTPNKMLLLLSMVTLTIACGGPLPEEEQLPAPDESTAAGKPSSELIDVASSKANQGPTIHAQTCQSDCDAEYSACAQQCDEMYPPPYEIDGGYQYCISGCQPSYDSCVRSTIVYKAPGNTICHLDMDRHLFGGIDFEFYTVDYYGQEDVCGPSATWYKKRWLDTVHCSYWTSMTDESECSQRIQDKFYELGAMGYYPTFDPATQYDTDYCPYPRL